MKLRGCLDGCSLGSLRQIAEHHGIALSEAAARGEVAQAVEQTLLAAGYLESVLGALRLDERRALAAAGSEGAVRGFVLERRLRDEADGPVQDGSVSELLGGLLRRGLLYRVFQAVGPERGEVFVVPEEVGAFLPAERGASRPELAPTGPPAESRRCSSALSLFALASFVRRERQRFHRTGEREGQMAALGRETADLAAELPGREPRERWTLLAHLAVQLGVFAREEAGLHPSDGFDEWLALGAAGEQRLWGAYVEADLWNDLERAGSGAGRYAGRTADPARARGQILEILRSLPTDEWLGVAEVEALVRHQAPDFLREGFEVASSRLLDLESGEVLAGAASWERVEGPLVRYLLSGPLFWLGVLEWGRGPDDWDCVRITQAGRAWLSGSEEVLIAPPEPIELGDERKLQAPQDCDLSLLWRLEPYLQLGRRGPPSEYALTRGSLVRGLEAGGSIDELRRLLEQASGGELPIGFGVALQRWSARAGRFRLRPMVVLLAQEENELSSVFDRLEDGGLIRERLGPCAAAVTAARALDVAEALERFGQIPELDAALRLMAGRRAYASLVDQQVLEALLFYIRMLRLLRLDRRAEIPQTDRLLVRIEDALGPIAAIRISRQARAAARKLRADLGLTSGRSGRSTRGTEFE